MDLTLIDFTLTIVEVTASITFGLIGVIIGVLSLLKK
jgi:hypothetical protein